MDWGEGKVWGGMRHFIIGEGGGVIEPGMNILLEAMKEFEVRKGKPPTRMAGNERTLREFGVVVNERVKGMMVELNKETPEGMIYMYNEEDGLKGGSE